MKHLFQVQVHTNSLILVKLNNPNISQLRIDRKYKKVQIKLLEKIIQAQVNMILRILRRQLIKSSKEVHQTILYYLLDKTISQEARQSRFLQDCKSQKNEVSHISFNSFYFYQLQITLALEAIWTKNNQEEHITALKLFSQKDILVIIYTLG